jgi:hypothetical protein
MSGGDVPLAFAWGPFVFWVAVSVTAGVILALLGAGVNSFKKRKERERQRAAEEKERRIPVRVGLIQIAAELRSNADIAARCWEQGAHVPSEVRTMSTEEWPSRANEMRALLDEDRTLWNKVQDTYEALKASRQSGGYPPKPEELRQLANECEQRAG